MTVGVVLMAYGTPSTLSDVESYYTHIRGGRAPDPAQLAELTHRYETIGGVSPMAERTQAQVDAIAASLGEKYKVRLGQKHSAPFVEDAVQELADSNVERIVGLVLAPHYSSGSIGQYMQRASETAESAGVPFSGIKDWHMLDPLLEFNAAAIQSALEAMPKRTKVIFTAHSLPESVLSGDPYADQLHESAAETARRAGLATWAGWGLGWQSAAKTPVEWRGPDISEIISDLAGTGRSQGVLVVPQGFTCDHMEVLHDLDIVADVLRRAMADSA